VRDTVRYFGDPEKRRKFHLASERELTARKINFIRISRSAKQRPAIAIEAVATLMR
jgi:nicotinamide riboside kinase